MGSTKRSIMSVLLGIGPSLLLSLVVLTASFTLSCLASSAQAQPEASFVDRLKKGQAVSGFRTVAIYLNAADRPMGARFLHLRTGFTFDVLQIPSVPQGFVWVNTLPTSDKGEPHTQEHLLLGKGNKGRSVANLESMALVEESAMTMQWRTCYHFNTTAGGGVFYTYLERSLDALLHPDYTDEEIHREVRNFGLTKNPADNTLRLEEKGSVYNEMVGGVDDPGSLLWRAENAAVYGKEHPLYYESGGTPAGLRLLTPAEIRAFHRRHYVLSNMGMIASFPANMPIEQVLPRMDALLNRLQPRPATSGTSQNEIGAQSQETDIPAFPTPRGLTPGSLQIVPFPDRNARKPGSVEFMWPADRKLDSKQQLLLELFLNGLAGDPSTPLYRRFIDSKTRVKDLGATGVSGYVREDQGFPVGVGLSDVAQAQINEKEIAEIRAQVLEELARIANWKDGSPELVNFNANIRGRLQETRRRYSKFVNSPPGFGFRWNDGGWMSLFLRLEREGGFRRSVTLKPEFGWVEKLLAGRANIWREYLAQWRLTNTVPYATATRPDPELVTRNEREKEARVAAETARLKQKYGAADDQEALRHYQADYDLHTASLDTLAQKDLRARFIDTPPMTLDDSLDYKSITLPGGVPLVASTFDNMTGATTSLALRLDGVPENDLPYLSLLPELLTQVGVLENGKPISYERMLERWRREILSLNAGFSTDFRTGRCELELDGAGNDPAEAKRAVAWMRTVLLHPDWRTENLPRLRDVVDQALTALRNRRQGYEEFWVNGVSAAYWRQDNPLLLTTRSFLTQMHNAQRLRWLLRGGASPGELEAIAGFLENLGAAGRGASRPELQALLSVLQKEPGAAEKAPSRFSSICAAFEHLSPDAAKLAADAANDLAQDLSDIPDANLAGDWSALCAEIRHDLLIPPAQTLAKLDAVRQTVCRQGGARLSLVGAGPTQTHLQKPIAALLDSLDRTPFQSAVYSKTPRIVSRLRERLPNAAPVYVGLVNPNTLQGVFMNSAPALKYMDTDPESLLRFLAFKLYAGGGAHSIFMKTWGAGLAYGNGLGAGPNGRMSYYADKTPELPQTLRFVIDQLKKAPRDPLLTDYAIAQAFSSRAASGYEARAAAMAQDLADGTTPELVRNFRKAILALRSRPDLANALYDRMLPEYAKVLPGLGSKGAEVPGAVYFIIGAEKQFRLYEGYLKSVEGPQTQLFRLYGRDFWIESSE